MRERSVEPAHAWHPSRCAFEVPLLHCIAFAKSAEFVPFWPFWHCIIHCVHRMLVPLAE